VSAIDEYVIADLGELSAQRLIGKMARDEDETVLVLGDGDGEVQVSAAIGSRAAAASRLERCGAADAGGAVGAEAGAAGYGGLDVTPRGSSVRGMPS
jgi:hypothetical protein